MDTKIKNYLGVAIIAVLLVFGYALIRYVETYGKSVQPGTYRSFAVSAEGKTIAVPDVAKFTFSVVTEGNKDVSALQEENVRKANRAIEFVKSKGVDKKDIKTQAYNIEPRYQYYDCRPPVYSSLPPVPCPPPEIAGYTIRQSVEVKIRDFETIGDIVGGVVQNGANEVTTPQFTVDDPTELQNQARAEAIKKAEAKAKATARAAGFTLGRLLAIDEGGFYYPQIYAAEAFGKGGAIPDAAPPRPVIEPGSQDIVVTVTLRYEID